MLGTLVLLQTFTVHSRARAVHVHVYKIIKVSNTSNKFTTLYLLVGFLKKKKKNAGNFV